MVKRKINITLDESVKSPIQGKNFGMNVVGLEGKASLV